MNILVYDYAVECFIGGITSPPNAQAVLLKRNFCRRGRNEDGRKARMKTKGDIMKEVLCTGKHGSSVEQQTHQRHSS